LSQKKNGFKLVQKKTTSTGYYFRNPVIEYLLAVLILFMTMFTLYRLSLLLTNIDLFKNIPIPVIVKAFIVGWRFDLAVTLYPLSLFFVLNYLFYFFGRARWLRTFNNIYLTAVFLIYLFLNITEIEFFRYFHVRLNSYIMNWEKNIGFILKMIWESYPVIPYLLLIVILSWIAFWIFSRIQQRFYAQQSAQPLFMRITMFLLATPILFIGIRGTLSYKTPLRWGHAYFSTYNAANQLALNGIFTLANDLLYEEKDKADLAGLLHIASPENAYMTVEKMVRDSSATIIHFPVRRYHYSSPPENRNIVIFLLESYSSYGLQQLQNQGIDTYLGRLIHKSFYFPNFYSNGFHTYMGVFSTLFGMPNVAGQSIMKRNEGQQIFSGLPNILKKQGYHIYFGISHDPNFDNMAGFLRSNGADSVISQFDFPQSEVLSSLGVADHKMFARMNELLRKSPQPFLSIILSSNNHGPWIIPEVKDHTFISTLHYTDWALEYFMHLASQEDYFRNTIFAVTGDHGKSETPVYDFDLQSTHIPLVIYDPENEKAQVRQNICSQIDVEQLLSGILHRDYITTALGRDVIHLPNQQDGFAMMQEGKMLGLVWNDWYLIDRIGGTPSLYRYRSDTPIHDYASEKPELVAHLQQMLRSYYFVGNDMILHMKVSPDKWY
jgi:phosphoglycerol transferase MdoB-like AlkP superfamily enzyme